MRNVRLLVADSTPLLRRLIAERMEQEADIEVVGEAEGGVHAIEMTAQLRPDVVLLRLELADVNGAEAAQQIRARLPNTQIVLLTAHSQLTSLGRGCGAADCLDLDCTPQDMLEAVRRAGQSTAAARDPAPTRPTLPARPAPAPVPVNRRRHAVAHLFTLAHLSPRECAVVEKMVLTEETAAQIARTLSRETNERYTESAVKHALDRALGKMHIEPRTRTALLRRVLDTPFVAPSG